MIVIVGSPAWRPSEPAGPAGRTCAIALAAAARGATVEVVGRIGDDPAGDALVIALTRGGVGHAALLRDPTQATSTARVAPDPEPSEPSPAGEDPAAEPLLVIAPGPRLEPADVALGLSYLTAFGVLVLADDAPAEVLATCVEGAAFAGAHLVVVVAEGEPVPDGLPEDATVLAAPRAPAGEAVAAVVGAYAAALDAGVAAADAFAAAVGASG